MTVNDLLREDVRKRASFACEYCGITETHSAGRLAIDHYQPKARGGSDDQENLVFHPFGPWSNLLFLTLREGSHAPCLHGHPFKVGFVSEDLVLPFAFALVEENQMTFSCSATIHIAGDLR